METKFAFIDESGNSDIETEKPGASNYFIVVAILIGEEAEPTLREQVEEVRKKHFGSGEMKSSGISAKDSHKRRIKILSDIIDLDFKFYALAVDKSAIRRDGGLRYKQSFIKFVNGMVYNNLLKNFADLRIIADAHGGDKFIESFQDYIIENHKPDLFWKSQVEMVSSKDNVLVQLADLVVGTIAQVYEGKSGPGLNESFLEMLKKRSIRVDEWPTKYQAYNEKDAESSEFDSFIHNHALAQAEIFLQKHSESKDDDIRLQVATLGFLVYVSRFDSLKSFVSTGEILKHLGSAGFRDVTVPTIRSSIVAPMRDAGVIIASGNMGYKIPKNFGDFLEFVDRVNGIVMPLLERLQMARSSYLLASAGDVDLLKGVQHPTLVAFLDQLDKK